MVKSPRCRRAAALALAAAALAPLAGCISLGPKTPPSLIRLSPAALAPADAGQPLTAARSVTVVTPRGPQSLAVPRVPVRSGTAQLAYLKGAQYADAPFRLLGDLIGETIQARDRRPVLDGRDYHLAPGVRLETQVIAFGVDADARQVELVIDALLQQPAAPGAAPVVTTRRFEAHVPVSAVTTAVVAPALGQAANDVAAQVADWIGR